MPQNSAELLAALLAKGALVDVCVVPMVGVMTPCTTQHQPGADLAQVMGLDMAVLCQLTSDRYFQQVSTAVILEAIGEFAPDHVTQPAKLTKGDIVNEAERLNDDTGRMPVIFRAEGPQQTEQDVTTQADEEATEDAAAMRGLNI